MDTISQTDPSLCSPLSGLKARPRLSAAITAGIRFETRSLPLASLYPWAKGWLLPPKQPERLPYNSFRYPVSGIHRFATVAAAISSPLRFPVSGIRNSSTLSGLPFAF